ncbi:MAG: aldehyde dehydrogenase family protein [Anaerolineales bacterium]|nr:aldehyde dehydrogenase family protein [Anaerolineales bacterium]
MEARPVLPFINPATGERFGQVAVSTPAEAKAAVAELRAAFPAWSAQPVSRRVAVLRELQRVLIDATDEITAVISQDTGKPRQDALLEVLVTVDMLADACRHAPAWLRREHVASGLYLFKRFYVERRPYGVVLVLGPWNYPLALVLPGVIAALLAGNTVAVKPSEVCAATGVLVERLLARVPALAPYVRVLHGGPPVGQALVTAPPDFIFLTGSSGTGKRVMRAAADQLTPLVVEGGGKDAMLVLEDADLAAAAEWGAWGAHFNAGQSCVAVERVYVAEQVYGRFVDVAVRATEALQVGYDLDPRAPYQVGPITSPAQMAIIEAHMAEALAQGARVLTGGRRRGQFYEPTVLVDVTHAMRLMREETFGPIMPIMPFHDEAEAVQLANDSTFGLSASIWSRDLERAQAVARRLNTGSVIINDTIAHFGVPQLPFGGQKDSGFGRTHGRDGLRQFTQAFGLAVGSAPQALDVAAQLRYPGHYGLAGAILRLVFGVTPRQRSAPLAAAVRRAGLGRVLLSAGAAGLITAAAFAFSARRRSRRAHGR